MGTPLILHHYEASPFSEKVRRILAYKRLPWTAVRAPAVMPKPDLLALTGGYRKVPVLQVGNHVYCDTSLIARVIDADCPEPSLFPTPIAAAIAEWADTQLFNASLPYVLRPSRIEHLVRWFTPDELARFSDDRRAMGKDLTRTPPSSKTARAYFGAYLARIEASLERSAYLLGAAPCISDFAVYHSLWVVSLGAPEALAAFPRARDFVERLSALPDATVSTLSSEQAIALCRDSDPEWQPSAAQVDANGLAIGHSVQVRAADVGRDPVVGALASVAVDEVVVRRQDERAGTVYVHFPRLGFELSAAPQ